MPTDWDLAGIKLRLIELDPLSLGGAVIHMRAGPARDAVIAALPGTPRRIAPGISDEQLFGGLDLAATLSAGQPVSKPGLLQDGAAILLSMSERCPPDLAAKLAQALDQSLLRGLFALDESIEPDERTPTPLTDRLAFWMAPEGHAPPGWPYRPDTHPLPDANPADIAVTEAQLEMLVDLAARFGITSLRAPAFALAAARGHAALCDRDHVIAEDLEIAVALVYPQRATQLPADEDVDDSDPLPPSPQDDAGDGGDETPVPEGDMLVEAVAARLPADLLAGFSHSQATRGASGAGAGIARKGNRRGRPLPSRAGRLADGARVDLVATLRNAAPWQPMRRAARPDREGLHIFPSDIRIKRFAERSDRLLIFAVDASGSAALARLNEAKGAIELLLADAYAQRDHVALIAFRGTEADLLLAPTRALVAAKRHLAAMPGGGGTPLALGLKAAAQLAEQARGRGLTPTVILITDGRANISIDGTPDRARAMEDADAMAMHLQRQSVPALVIDTALRRQSALETLSHRLGARYVPLPRADARTVSAAVQSALDGA